MANDVTYCSMTNSVLMARDAHYDEEGRAYRPELAPHGALPFLAAIDKGWLKDPPPAPAAGAKHLSAESWTKAPPGPAAGAAGAGAGADKPASKGKATPARGKPTTGAQAPVKGKGK